MKRSFAKLDGRHKLAILGALVCWVLSVYFSYLGFKVDNTNMLWVGWVMALVVTIVELAFNTPVHKLPLTLVVIGIICYAYGIWTNITGFWSLQHPGVPFEFFSIASVMPIIIGFILEVLPEPLLMWGIMADIDGDFLGNISGLWSGDLKVGGSSQQTTKEAYPSKYMSHLPKARYIPPEHDNAPDIPQFLTKLNKTETNHYKDYREKK
jgi:hypothetical protein